MVENGKETHNLTQDELKMAIENTESFKAYLDYWKDIKKDLIEKDYQLRKSRIEADKNEKELFWNMILAGIGIACDYVEQNGGSK